MRSFIAIEIDDDTRGILSSIQNQLRHQGIKGNYSRAENLHLTLKFLGEIDKATFQEVAMVIKKVACANNSFVLNLTTIGRFRKGNKMIIWSALKYSEKLFKVYYELEQKLGRILFAIDKKEYSPHITLVREATPLDKIYNFMSNYKQFNHQFCVKGISLMESIRIDGKLTYIRRAYEPFNIE